MELRHTSLLVFLILRTIANAIEEGSNTNEPKPVICVEPPEPQHGRLECEVSEERKNWFVCRANCDDGYFFPDKKKTKKRACNLITGQWKPDSKFPNCNPICQPPCDNGGECIEDNICICPPAFRGHRCQYELEHCDPYKRFSHAAEWNCSHSQSETFCTLRCPVGTEYEFSPPNLYHCTLAGAWTPDIVPQCNPINSVDLSSVQEMHKNKYGTESLPTRSSVCSTWRGIHYRTFDGSLYSFQGNCSYIFSRDCSDNLFFVHLTFGSNPSVDIYIGENVYTLARVENTIAVEFNEATYIVPTSINGILFQKVSHYVTVASSIGFQLKWDGRYFLSLQLNQQLKNKTCGLCGKYDDDVGNDYELADGTITHNSGAFVNSWIVENSKGEQCNNGFADAATCAIKEANRASESCNIIFDTKYSSCHIVLDPHPYYKTCKMDFCSCTEDDKLQCICDSLNQYFLECIRFGGNLENGWRNDKLCSISCPVGMTYHHCDSACPTTCKGTVYDCEDDHCIEGCHCQPGLVLHNGQCISKEECPCLHNGHEYADQKRIRRDCNACECHKGLWHCTNEQCEGRCSSVGDPHYTTFDGKQFDFVSSCPLYLISSENVSIIQESVACESDSDVQGENTKYCTKALNIYYLGSTLVLKPEHMVTFDDKEIELPFHEAMISVFHSSSEFTKVTLSNNMSVLWDGKNRVYIDAPPSQLGQTKGLCGTYNNNPNDDFLTPDGDLETDVNIFASRWQVSDSCHKRARRSDRTLCVMKPQKLEEAVQLCRVMMSENFAACHDAIDPQPHFRNCINDMCACSGDPFAECLCPALADYASSCARMGVILNWANEISICRPACSVGQVYHECKSPCESSCKAISVVGNCEENSCVQGCACPNGMTLNSEGFCIPIDQCPCLYQGREYAAGTFTTQETQTCECENAIWKCHYATLAERDPSNEVVIFHNQSIQCYLENNEEYSSCLEKCPMSCQNMHLPQFMCKADVCQPGCRCLDGYILDNDLGRCVELSKCGCRHGGKRYNEGEHFKKDCNTCYCKENLWQCTEETCPGMCTVWGESHHKTFDGQIYDFHGSCEYTLVKGTTHDNSFIITMQTVPCSTRGATCGRSFTLKINNEHKITLSKDELLPAYEKDSPFVVIETGLHVILYTNIGLTLQWDKNTLMMVTLQTNWRSKVVGLCGNFNGDPADDFQTPSGELPETQVESFADSWKINEFCPFPQTITEGCLSNPARHIWAQKKCAVLKSDIFAPCHSEVQLEIYYDRCVFDSCACDEGGDCECLCTAIAAYAHECNIHGIHVKWRSQELCPIQCEDCASYESCISPCPVESCESKAFTNLQPTNNVVLEDICHMQTCVEGCKPKPCPIGQVHTSSKDLKCILESECTIPCAELNGKWYTEGERITDPSIADVCQSCHCLQGSKQCTGSPCPTTLPPKIPPAHLEVKCQVTGWSPWMNSPTTFGGDSELLSDPYIMNMLYDFCSINDIVDIQCRVATSKIPYNEAGQKIYCSLPEGLLCTNKQQYSGACEDYEMRVFCNCGCSPGWTKYFNVDNPQLNADHNDEETIENIMVHHSICPYGIVDDVECNTIIDGQLIDYKDTGEFGLKCSKRKGFLCNSLLRQKECLDYQIRFYCSCEKSESPLTLQQITTTPLPTTTENLCPPGEIFDECAYRCNQTCSAFGYQLSLDGKCLSGEEDCIASCRPVDGCSASSLWRDYYNCVPISECTCIIPEDNGQLLYVAPNSVITRDCMKCQCVENSLSCHHIPYCGETTVITTTTTEFSTTVTPMKLINIETPECWTEWINLDSPDSLGGDIEDLATIRRNFEFCFHPVKIECRTVRDKKLAAATGQLLMCDLEFGLKCWNSDNAPHGCYDFEIRFYCPCEPLTTTRLPSATPSSTMAPAPCVYGWTQWYDSHIPDTSGEYETVHSVRSAGGYFCANEMIEGIECRRKGSEDLKLPLQHGALCNLETGFYCSNEYNNDLDQCFDHEVRFFCACSMTTFIPEIQTTESYTTPVTRRPKLLPCSSWSDWINQNHPSPGAKSVKGVKGSRSVTSDFEKRLLLRLQQEDGFCLQGYISAIECREAVTDLDYRETGDMDLQCHAQSGFRCKGRNQPSGVCRDYKIRYFCQCEEAATTVVIRPTLTTLHIPQCDSYYEIIDGPIPLPDVNLKASTSLDAYSGPQNARLSTTQGKFSAGAWIAETVSNDQYLEADLGQVQPVYGVITKGMNGGNEYVTSYHLLYSRDGVSFSYVMESPAYETEKVFSGNYDSDSAVEHIFEDPFEARYVRIQPLIYKNEVALRVGFLGCAGGMITVATTQSTPTCIDEMGMKNGNISDMQISFSSMHDESALPGSIRLNTMQVTAEPGGWVAGELNQEQFVQVDFLEPRTITGVITQGRDLVPQWVTSFSISYSFDGHRWNNLLDKNGDIKVFPGNFDSYTSLTIFFPLPIRTRLLRLHPLTWNNWISMRLEIIGCFEPYEITTHSESVLEFTVTTPLPPYMTGICEEPMGFANGLLPDELITVSSSEYNWSGSSRIRLNYHHDARGSGGWVPSHLDHAPFVLIDFTDKRNLTGIVTQGREDDDNWVLTYTVEYSTDSLNWHFCRDLVKDHYIFPGNKDRNTPDVRLFDRMIEARFLKITIKTYHSLPGLRLEILGCYKPYILEESTPQPTTTEYCVFYGAWISMSDATGYGDEEPIEQLIRLSNACEKPLSIQCREVTTKKDYLKTGQNVICDLSHGFSCKNSLQENSRCFNYEARIGCWNCETTTELTTTPLPLVVCPETPIPLIQNCPLNCPLDYACDGYSCIPHTDCPCFANGKRFKVGNIKLTDKCDVCNCILGGHSKCEPIQCHPCGKGQISEMDKNCDCKCRGCITGTILCETSGQCIDEILWCDGTVDCPDDEMNCPTTAPPPTLPVKNVSTISCTLDTESATKTCEMNVNTFSTFDGLNYQYEICDHILMKEIDEHYLVTVHKECSEENVNQCERHVVIYVDDMIIQLGPGQEKVVFNGYEVPPSKLYLLTKRFPDFAIKKRGHQTAFRSYKYDFEVKWDSRQNAKITVSECRRYQIFGLCGFYNENAEDDFMLPSHSFASSSQDFGNGWSIGDLSRCSLPICSQEVMAQASHVCTLLLDEPFSVCSSHVNMNIQIDVCMASMCECMESTKSEGALEICKCQAFEAFVEECEEKIASPIREWRIKHDCTPDCPPGLEYQECGTGCDLTCDNYHERESICEDKCVPGCYCPPGLIHHNDRCVKQKMCQDCVCRGHGDPNYITFDNQYYAFQGNCTYILAQHQFDNELLDFRILGINFECPEEPHTSCTSGLKVIYRDHVVEKRQNQPVYLDGVAVEDSPFTKDGIVITFVPNKSTIIHIKAINLAVRYFDQMYAFNIELPAYHYFNKTEGLCGICNFDQSDDMYHRGGYLTDDVDDFAYSWLENNTRSECILPKVVVPTPPAEICNFTANACDMFIDPTLYSQSCQNDISHSHNPDASMCRSKFQYAQQCCEKDVSLKLWLIESGCESFCPDSMVFECTSACQKTCDSLQDSSPCDLMPLLTCTCPYEQVLKDGYCVDPESCAPEKNLCVYQHKFDILNGYQVPLEPAQYFEVTYELGSIWIDGLCRNCSCVEKDGLLASSCTVEQCLRPENFPDFNSYVREEETLLNECCPTYRRVQCISGGNTYFMAEEWPSPDGDKCKIMRCAFHPTGEAFITEKNILCDKTCPTYAEYEEPSQESDSCCGRCKPVACEEDGILYRPGAEWQSTVKPCFSAQCIVSENFTSITYTGKACQAVPPHCPPNHLVPDEDGCCFSCNAPTESCLPAVVDTGRTIHYFTFVDDALGMCMNLQPIANLTKCYGSCDTPSLYSPRLNDFANTCRCCLPLKTEKRMIPLDCADGSKVMKVYHQPIACQCSACSGTFEPQLELPPPY